MMHKLRFRRHTEIEEQSVRLARPYHLPSVLMQVTQAFQGDRWILAWLVERFE
ncbi:hypothetical protein [Hydrogenophaga sp. BPS33]|uniref:hypothetical protein n=1 Tax=Hydrogenophaga sp. BPS33 TaxID=2651974 RepID=UPI0013594AAE|nr:hypothetical protein [Hydrogenophaga sp. BPS33]